MDPLTKPRKKSWALLTVGWRSLIAYTPEGEATAQGERQCWELLDKLAGHTVYVRSRLTDLLHTTGAMTWQADVWRGRATRMMLDGSKMSVISLRGCLDGQPDPLGAMTEAFEFLALHGVYPASFGSMGWNLWRATLHHSLRISSPREVAQPAVFGGRQEAPNPKIYTGMMAADISSAYPFSMGARPYALSLRKVSPTTALDPTQPGLARATVSVVRDDMPYAPLPVRVGPDAIQWQWGVFDGTWTWGELAAAKSLGASVNVHDCWAPGKTADLFGEWWTLIMAGRNLSEGAAAFIKNIANSLWGSFGMKGDDTAVVRWVDKLGDHSVTVSHKPKNLPHHQTMHIAAESSSRVRVRMLTEGLYGTKFSPVHVDTDGIIIRKSADVPQPSGGVGPGQWRIKTIMRKVDIRAPQVYRYQCGKGCGVLHPSWHYVTAGVPPSLSESVFNRVGKLGVTIATGGRDIVLPPGHANDLKHLDHLKRAAIAAEATMFGKALGNDNPE